MSTDFSQTTSQSNPKRVASIKKHTSEELDRRRGFLKTSALVGAAGLSANTTLANEILTSAANKTDRVCYELGFSIGQNLAQQIGSSPNQVVEPLHLHYRDSAGATVDSLRLGLIDGISTQHGNRPLWSETQAYQTAVLGTASLLNPVTGATARVEIPTVALSHLELNRSSQVAIDFITTKLV
jgi:hypothetical protein